MKFVYVDESGSQGEGDVFVMAGLLIDAYRLRKHTTKFDEMITAFLAKHPGAPKELKTKAFINGTGGWSQSIPPNARRFLARFAILQPSAPRFSHWLSQWLGRRRMARIRCARPPVRRSAPATRDSPHRSA